MLLNPLGRTTGLKAGRIDNGVDYYAPAGQAICAPGIIYIYLAYTHPPGGTGQNDEAWIGFTFLDGPYSGKSGYFGEGLRPTVQSGDTVLAGQLIATFTAAARGIECGWAAGPSNPRLALAAQLGQSDPNGNATTAAGVSWNRLMISLGAPGGRSQGAIRGTMPSGYPPVPRNTAPAARAGAKRSPARSSSKPATSNKPVNRLGPWTGTYRPDYTLAFFRNGDPSRPVSGVNFRSITRIATSKTLDDIAGTFDITMKDRRAQTRVKPMDVVRIRLRGHNQGWGTVLIGVVDNVEPDGNAEVSSAQADITIRGRCTAKYLQVNSLFLPVWDPQANLPTALIFGKGDASNKLGTTVNAYTPRAIFGYVFDHFVVGQRNRVGLSGTPNARFWLNRKQRFEWVKDASGKVFQIPFIQFDEDTADVALTRLQIQGFTEAWVDEVGNIVYRRPQWDAPVSWNIHTGGLRDWSLSESDEQIATYVEVFPGALPALPSGVAQAMMAGRAPLPSDYVTGLHDVGFKAVADPGFIIDTDSSGKITDKGARNWYYQKQKTYGLRPYQITSPLLASREQAQAQAEGLLRFMLRWDKSGQITLPGEPEVRLGETIHLHGPLEDQNLDRTYYVQGIAHEYVESNHYTTTLTLSHGRDPGDPSWQKMMLPNFDPSQLANLAGLLSPKSSGTGTSLDTSFTGGKPTGSYQGLVSPFTKRYSATLGQNTDMGVDFGTQQGISPGDPILAIGDCYLRAITTFYAGQPGMWFELVNKSAGYWGWYVSEQINTKITQNGKFIPAGTVVATFASSGTGIEIGWAAGPGQTATQAFHPGQVATRHNGNGTTDGNNFFYFLKNVGAI